MSVREGCKREERGVSKRGQGWRKREGRGVGRDGVREDGIRYGKEANVVQRGAGYVQRKAHTNNHKRIDETWQVS